MSPEVLHLRSSAGLYGGDQAVLALNAALPETGVTSRLLCIENYLTQEQPLFERAREAGSCVELLPCHGRFDVETLGALRAQLRRSRLPILHVHDYKSAFYAWLSTRRGLRIPLVATLHGWVETTGALRIYKRVELKLLRRFDRVVVVADAQRETLDSAGIPSDRIRTIPNGIDAERFRPDGPAATPEEFGLPASAFLFGCVARLAPEKNLAALIDAVAALHHDGLDVALLLVGDGSERGQLEARARTAGCGERVRFAGMRHDTQRIYPLLDCFVLPSLTEGLPLSVLEAMACARPVIASAVGGIPDLIAGTQRGTTVPAADQCALLHAMRAALPWHAPDHAAREHVVRRYSVSAAASRYAELYRDLMEARHGRAIA